MFDIKLKTYMHNEVGYTLMIQINSISDIHKANTLQFVVLFDI